MANLSKYELAEDRYNTLITGGLTAREALVYMINNISLYIILQNIDSPQDRNLMNVQLANVMWYTKNVFMDGQTLQDILKFDTTNTIDPLYGQLVWDADNQTLAIGLNDGVILQSGQELLRIVKNNTASAITNGTVVKMVGSVGNSGRITVEPSTGLFDEAPKVFGIATHDIEANSDGFITVFGNVRGINTTGSTSGETWLDGDLLYLMPNDSGKLTKNVPLDTQIKMQVAKVVKAHTNGTLDVFVTPINENAVAASSKKLATARKINNVNFDGTADINIEARLATAIASAATTTIGTIGNGDTIHITGTTTITSLGVSQTGVTRNVVFDGALTLTYNATSLILPTSANIVTAAGDSAVFVCENGASGYWRCVDYTRRTGVPLTLGSLSTTGSAATLTTTRNVTLNGDVTGTGTFNGSADLTITATIAANSVALGTDTTGNYVAGNTAGVGITVTGTAGEGWSPTISLADVGTAGTYTKVTTNGKGQVTSGGALIAADIPDLDASKITSGIISADRLPSFVDDVLEFTNLAAFPATGETGKIYVALDTNKQYRWSGTVYVYITSGAVDSVNGMTGVVNVTAISGNSGTATALQTTRTFSATGDVTATAQNFNGSANVVLPLVLANSGVTAGSYAKVTVDAKGRVTAGLAPTMEDIPDAAFKKSARVATTANLVATYASNVLTMSAVGVTTIDGITIALNDRILIKDQTTQIQNGIYRVSTLGTASVATVFTRALDADTSSELAGSIINVDTGTANGGFAFTNNFKTNDIIGTNAVIFYKLVFENGTWNIAINGNAGTATALATGRTIGMTGDVTWTSASFNGSGNVTGTSTLATISDSGTGTFKKITTNTKGLVTGTQAVSQADITGLLGTGSITNAMIANTAVTNLSGKNTGDQTITLTGDITGSGTGSFAATLSNSGVTAGTYSKVTVDAKGRITGGSTPTMEDIPDATFKRSVRAATTANITLSATQTIDGIVLAVGDRVLVKDQTTTSQNGIYVVAAGAWTRALDADTASKIASALVAVDSGTVNGGKLFDNDFRTTDTLGTTAMLWAFNLDSGSLSSTTPLVAGTAAIGTGTTVARADHVHPAQTAITGNAGTATTLQTARTISGVSFNGSANIEIEDRLGTAIASAATTTIGTRGLGDYIHITGVATITSLGTAAAAGIRRTLIFDGALTLTHNATSLICPGAANIVTVAGTVIEVVAETTANWRVVSITHPSLSMAELGYLDGVTSAIQTQLNAKAALASPALTGTPTAPTAAVGTNTTQVATTAFVNAEIANDAVPRVASTDNAIVRFNGITGDVQDSGITIDDNGNIGGGTQSFNGFGGSGFKNYIINGNFDVWQRGITATISGNTYLVDRFYGWHSNGGTLGRAMGAIGFYNSLKVAGSSSGMATVGQRIEDINSIKLGTDGNTKVTISMYIKSNVASSGYIKLLIPTDANNFTTVTLAKSSAISITTGWTKVSATFDLDFTYWVGIDVYLQCDICTDLYTTGWQVEKGSVATPFENRPYGLELSLCQRYFQAWRHIGGAQTISTTQLQFTLESLKNMRVPPTLTSLASGSGSGAIFSMYGSSASETYFPTNCCVTSGEGIITVTLSGLIAGVSSVSIVGTASAEL